MRSYLKKRILVQDVGGFGFQTAGIRRYVEDLKPGPNTQLGPKDFFVMASKNKTALLLLGILFICVALPLASFSAALAKKINYARCLDCHAGIEKISSNHDFECAQCHLRTKPTDQLFLTDHSPILRNPSALDHVDNFCGKCHQQEIERLAASLHGTMAGIINQTRYLWGAQETSQARYSLNATIAALPESSPYPDTPAKLVDDFLRRKCLRCHLYTEGVHSPGDFRASGCAACHVFYNNAGTYAGNDAAIDKTKSGYPQKHRFVRAIPNDQCLHCHHGNRVGADYEGLFEHDFHKYFRSGPTDQMPEARLYGIEHHRLSKDIHAAKGLLCVDCHNRNIMGDGRIYANKYETPRKTCAQCHGGYSTKPRLSNAELQFKSKTNKIYTPRPFSKDIPAHNPKFHNRIKCSACHAQWSYQDYGLSVIRIDAGDINAWKPLTIQGDPLLEKTLADYFRQPDKAVLSSQDYLSGKLKRGVWLTGFRLRRWEFMPLGVDHKNRISIIRPQYQYHLSFIDRWEASVMDNLVPQRGDSNGAGWAFMPYSPHTISAKGRNCYACHLNPVAAGFGVLEAGTQDLELTAPSPPAVEGMRKLNPEEISKLLKPSSEFKHAMLKTYLRPATEE
jgi:hypothetical protein